MAKELEFTAVIKVNEDSGGGAYIEFPFDAEEVFGKRGRVKVLCHFDGIEYRGSLVRMGTRCHLVGLRKDIMAALGKKPGDELRARIAEDLEERIVTVPAALREGLEKAGCLEAFKAVSYTRQKEFASLIDGAKQETTRQRRLARIIEELEPRASESGQSLIAAHIKGFDGIKRTRLEEIYTLIKAEAPEALEKIAYGMPTFFLNENLVHFAAQARHLGFYPTPSAIEAFEEELGAYRYSKGAIQFPYDEDLPRALILKIVRFRVREAREKIRNRKLSKK